jgi:hypothetical protein
MISHCANPDCSMPFHYLRGGRLYRFEVRRPSAPCQDVPNAICDVKPSSATVFFWLCETCCAKLTLKFVPKSGVRLVPLSSSGRLSSAPVVVGTTTETSDDINSHLAVPANRSSGDESTVESI